MDMEKYFIEKGCNYWREFPFSYGGLNVVDKTIQIVGADCGSSALFLLLQGARWISPHEDDESLRQILWKGVKHIIQYEKEEQLRQKWNEVCREFNICDKSTMKGEWKGEYEDVDVFIMDCEGCEKDLDVDVLKKYEQWCIGVHDWTENRVSLIRKLAGNVVTYVSDDGREITICKKV